MDSLNLGQRLKKLEERVERLKEITFNNLGDIELSIFNLEDKLGLVKFNTQNNGSYTQNLVSNNNLTNLTNAEKRILEMRKQGYTQRAIAESTLTTETNVSQIMKKIRGKLIKE